MQRYEFFYLKFFKKLFKMSSDLNTERLKVALWQNAYLNFCKLFCKILKDKPPVSIMNRDFFRDDYIGGRKDRSSFNHSSVLLTDFFRSNRYFKKSVSGVLITAKFISLTPASVKVYIIFLISKNLVFSSA